MYIRIHQQKCNPDEKKKIVLIGQILSSIFLSYS